MRRRMGVLQTPSRAPERGVSATALGPVSCFMSIPGQCHPLTVLFIEVLICSGTGKREPLASYRHHPVTLMFTALGVA